MTTWKQLSAPLRVTIAAPWCLLVALLCAGAAGMIEVKIDPDSHEPINTTVSLSGTHWTGTLDPARLSASVPLLDDGQNLNLPGGINIGGNPIADPSANLYADAGNGVVYATVFSTLSGAGWNDNGAGGWQGPNWNLAADGSFANGYGYGIDASGDVNAQNFNSATGATWADDGSAGWSGPGGLHFDAYGNAQAGSFSGGSFNASGGASWQDDGSGGWSGPGGSGLNVLGTFYGDGSGLGNLSLPASVPQLDPADQSLSLPGDLTVGSAVTAYCAYLTAIYASGGDLSVNFDATTGYLEDDASISLSWTYDGVAVTNALSVGGNITTDNGNIYSDGSGDLAVQGVFTANNMYLSGQLTLGQSFQAGTITPDHYFTVQDAYGTEYVVPCVAR